MKLKHFIAMDVHCSHTTIEVQTRYGEVIRRLDLPTATQALTDAVKDVPGPRGVVIEESTMADWAYRVLRPFADEVVVCDPRRNRLVSEGDKDDSVDPGKLAELYRLNGLRAVHHPDRQSMVDQRRWVWLYHDQVELVVAAKNKIKAAYRSHGVRYGSKEVYLQSTRGEWLKQLPGQTARRQVELLYRNLDHLEEERFRLAARMRRVASRHPVVKTFLEIPGYGAIYAMTFWVIVDTPWRFNTVRKLWTYAGLGLERNKSGLAKAGKPHTNGPLHLNYHCNRRLKNVAKGVATSALKTGGNAFASVYERLVAQDTAPSNAKLTVSRKALAVPWAMWKRGERYRTDLV